MPAKAWHIITVSQSNQGHQLSLFSVKNDHFQVSGFEKQNPLVDRLWGHALHLGAEQSMEGVAVTDKHTRAIKYLCTRGGVDSKYPVSRDLMA